VLAGQQGHFSDTVVKLFWLPPSRIVRRMLQ
jgi:hypothetical protein